VKYKDFKTKNAKSVEISENPEYVGTSEKERQCTFNVIRRVHINILAVEKQ
jgi:hypothetical protein